MWNRKAELAKMQQVLQFAQFNADPTAVVKHHVEQQLAMQAAVLSQQKHG